MLFSMTYRISLLLSVVLSLAGACGRAKQNEEGVDTAPSSNSSKPVVSEARPSSSEPIGYEREDYIWLDNVHKEPMPGGPTAGWDLALRRADGCLLIIESSTGAGGKNREVIERSYQSSDRFQYEPNQLEKFLLRRLEREGIHGVEAARLVKEHDKCSLGHRLLIRDAKTGNPDALNEDDSLSGLDL